MVLVGRPAGRVGRCQELILKPGSNTEPGFYFGLAKICRLKKDPESIFHRSFIFRVLVGNKITYMVSLGRWKDGPGFFVLGYSSIIDIKIKSKLVCKFL